MNMTATNELTAFSQKLELASIAMQVAKQYGDDAVLKQVFNDSQKLVESAEAFALREKIDTNFEPIY